MPFFFPFPTQNFTPKKLETRTHYYTTELAILYYNDTFTKARHLVDWSSTEFDSVCKRIATISQDISRIFRTVLRTEEISLWHPCIPSYTLPSKAKKRIKT